VLAEELGSGELAFNAAYHRTGALLESADIHSAERGVAEMERLAAQLRQPHYTWSAALGRATLATTPGALEGSCRPRSVSRSSDSSSDGVARARRGKPCHHGVRERNEARPYTPD